MPYSPNSFGVRDTTEAGSIPPPETPMVPVRVEHGFGVLDARGAIFLAEHGDGEKDGKQLSRAETERERTCVFEARSVKRQAPRHALSVCHRYGMGEC